MRLKKFFKWLFTFDDYMRIYVLVAEMIVLFGMTKFFYLISTVKGILAFFVILVGFDVFILLILHFFQTLCRRGVMNKIYENFKRTIYDTKRTK